MTPQRLLLVSRDAGFVRAAREHLAGPGAAWTLTAALSGAHALTLLEQQDFQAVVVDRHLGDMPGKQVFTEVTALQPGALRVFRADLTDPAEALMCLGLAHQIVPREADLSTLAGMLVRVQPSAIWSPSSAVQNVLARVRELPSPPTVYFKIVRAVQSPEATVETIGEIISQDPALTARLLHLANSAAFSLASRVTHPTEAVMYLGLEMTESLVLVAHTFSYFTRIPAGLLNVEALWRHSSATGRLAQRLARLEQTEAALAGAALTAGLLHDLGKLLLAFHLPAQFEQAAQLQRARQCPGFEAETEVFGTDHAEVGACLLSLWGLPLPIVEAVALHHYPARLFSDGFSPLTAVHVANVLAHEAEPSVAPWARPGVDPAYLAHLSLENRLPDWREVCLNGCPSA
jgi:putative nucleotidyltransferase with HDIG domain